jgi:putative glutamine amidotransferase
MAEREQYTSEAAPSKAIPHVAGAIAVLIPELDAEAIVDSLDGLMVPGGITNVHPALYGEAATPEKGPFDPDRDATSLPLIRAALQRGLPILTTCRGFQELNVALGGTLSKEAEDLPEEEKHGTPASAKTEDERFRIWHQLNVVSGGQLAAIPNTERGARELTSQPAHRPARARPGR